MKNNFVAHLITSVRGSVYSAIVRLTDNSKETAYSFPVAPSANMGGDMVNYQIVDHRVIEFFRSSCNSEERPVVKVTHYCGPQPTRTPNGIILTALYGEFGRDE